MLVMLGLGTAQAFTVPRAPALVHRVVKLFSNLKLDFGYWEKELGIGGGSGTAAEPQLLDSEEGTPFPNMPLPEEVFKVELDHWLCLCSGWVN